MNKPLDLLVVGHVALDTVIHVEAGVRKVCRVSTGGAVTFSSLATKTSAPALNVGIATKVGHDFPAALLDPFTRLGVNLDGLVHDEASSTTRFELVYDGPARTVACPVQCSPMRVDEFPPGILASRRIHLGPLCREIGPAFIEHLGDLVPLDVPVGIDLQGFIRDVHGDGSITFIPAAGGAAIVALLHELFGSRLVIKGDDAECRAIMPGDDGNGGIDATMTSFLEVYPDATILITSGRNGSMIGRVEHGRHVTRRVPAFQPRSIIDETGAGDTFLGSFLSRLAGPPGDMQACQAAALFGSAASSFLVEAPGIDGFRPAAEIEARVASQRYFIA